MSEWTVRDAVREDEPCIIQMWMTQLLRFTFGRSNKPRPERGSDEHIAFWRAAQPVVEGLLRSRNVVTRVACDPTRSAYAPGLPAVVVGWSMFDGSRLYGIGIKRDFLPSTQRAASENALLREIGGELVAALRPQDTTARRVVMPLYDLRALDSALSKWPFDNAWLDMMSDVSRLAAEDATSADVSRHVLDPNAPRWVPNEQRAA